ncbi:uncharacterized protein L969DRAFT_43860 [Mixia osmundae IAM 14324]|uniref:MSP domain-containing protein n=1 Tax=Mixia osmundae (strain CBS 9802 / IAM 14324 / JCM 22182 / KY 12970) TaxID=764103 RepID=G7DTE3_MIXOS|nr:uncharacterized protein L969DRAFT_43860 [Mixia osmundae IAM 14324]KEI42872.1 hypothetical protein L969DRAFT_43860 [Mixia osmundae IAM 14324]GAA93790.1 hypothetical protein E5Q_00436 [Mixia osmundae IAM 14324]
MSVDLSPNGQLGFHRPLTQLVKRTLTVANTNSQPVVFKVKTTAPKQYCVRPNSGRIEPGERVEVQVLLQPMKEDPAPGAKCKDKFLVQSAIVTPDKETQALADLWSHLEKEEKASIHEQKIRCAYLASIDGAGAEDTNAADMTQNDSTHNDSLMAANTTLPSQSPPVTTNGFSDSTDKDYSSSLDNTARPSGSDNTTRDAALAGGVLSAGALGGGLASLTSGSNAATASPAAPAAFASRGNAEPASLSVQLEQAKAEIQRLQSQLSGSSELRQRNVASSSSPIESASSSDVASLPPPGHVTLQTLGIVAFLTFFFTWCASWVRPLVSLQAVAFIHQSYTSKLTDSLCDLSLCQTKHERTGDHERTGARHEETDRLASLTSKSCTNSFFSLKKSTHPRCRVTSCTLNCSSFHCLSSIYTC